MLALLTKRWRTRAAILLVAAYALCLVAPTAVFAFSNAPGAAHCMTDDHHGLVSSPLHKHGGATHHHQNNGDDEHVGKCCGLFCLSAVSPDTIFVAAPQVHAAVVAMPRPDTLNGRGADRIDRPPRSLSSV